MTILGHITEGFVTDVGVVVMQEEQRRVVRNTDFVQCLAFRFNVRPHTDGIEKVPTGQSNRRSTSIEGPRDHDAWVQAINDGGSDSVTGQGASERATHQSGAHDHNVVPYFFLHLRQHTSPCASRPNRIWSAPLPRKRGFGDLNAPLPT